MTVTVTLDCPGPPGPLQLIVKVVVPERTTLRLPESARLPDQPPDAVIDVAFADDHDKVVVPPCGILIGFAVTGQVAAGGGGGEGGGGGAAKTVMVVAAVACPPGPVQLTV
ncbi:MAG: hypothetical protein A2758_02180 [Candidatus Zambryskibacteria bacterium RIFCSPHIGHO2_01_FULL_49_18]|uniref:Uncharacterized protein n=2 Tax=Candidatus Zambryskiibacteriota TaxID=1817925 RepID=A0A1G2T295_9BACT|nr:MAG: hypothetical protein A2758_02180 [Candidatus Zambryskibacteria bacterium RIFCSPHIGHO2_01_FULL_49_18]OHB06133.1 MAG: hypothetical protein A3A26_01140 [Candidatus Zambryskibacteria bacterium RIFCSPLOWO2_01_FULL_47_14]